MSWRLSGVSSGMARTDRLSCSTAALRARQRNLAVPASVVLRESFSSPRSRRIVRPRQGHAEPEHVPASREVGDLIVGYGGHLAVPECWTKEPKPRPAAAKNRGR
jgi:hypothetical protein